MLVNKNKIQRIEIVDFKPATTEWVKYKSAITVLGFQLRKSHILDDRGDNKKIYYLDENIDEMEKSIHPYKLGKLELLEKPHINIYLGGYDWAKKHFDSMDELMKFLDKSFTKRERQKFLKL